MILRVDPKPASSAELLSLPRDLWVPIAGTGGKQRINTAHPGGGPERLIETIKQNFGIPINHYVRSTSPASRARRRGRRRARSTSRRRRATTSTRGFQRRRARVRHPRRRPGAGLRPVAPLRVPRPSNGSWTDRPDRRPRPHQPPAGVHQAGAQAGHRQGRAQPVRAQPADRAWPRATSRSTTTLTTEDLRRPRQRSSGTSTPTRSQVYTPPATGGTIGGADVLDPRQRGGPADLRPLPGAGRRRQPAADASRSRCATARARPARPQDVLPTISTTVGFTHRRLAATPPSFRNSADRRSATPPAPSGRGQQVARYLDGTPQFTVDKTLDGQQRACWSPARTSRPAPHRSPPGVATSPASLPTTTTTTVDPTSDVDHRVPTTQAGMVPEPPDGEVCG